MKKPRFLWKRPVILHGMSFANTELVEKKCIFSSYLAILTVGCFFYLEGYCVAAEEVVPPVEILQDATNKASETAPALPVMLPAEQPAVPVIGTNMAPIVEGKIVAESPQKPAGVQDENKPTIESKPVTVNVPPKTNETLQAEARSLSAETPIFQEVGSKTNDKPQALKVQKTTPAVTVRGPLKKAEDGAKDEKQIISDELAAAKAKLMEFSATRNKGKLKDLERKAMEYDSISTKLELKDQLIEKLKMELKAAQNAITNQQAEIVYLVSKTNELVTSMSLMTKEKAPLKEALDVLRLGKYEYYQIEENDTCESIAAKPSIYGDALKHTLIRQANKGHVTDLDKLVPGEVLIIPRVTVSERHDF